MKKKEIIIAILLVIFVVFNACGSYLEYYMTCKVGYLVRALNKNSVN